MGARGKDCAGPDDGPGADFAKVGDHCSGSDLGAGADRDVSADRGPGADGDEIADAGSGDEHVSVDVGVAAQSGFGSDGAIGAHYDPARGRQIAGDGRLRVDEGDSAFRPV